MNDQKHFDGLKRMYYHAAINREIFTDTQMFLEPGKCKIKMAVSDSFYHALGAVHGSVYFKLLDDAAFFSVQSVVTDNFILTASFNIHFLRPVTEGVIECQGTLRHNARNFFSAESSIRDEKGREIGFGSGNFVKSRHSLESAAGYSG